MKVAEQIKKLRKGKITQKELAKKLHKSERMIQKYESGEVIPSVDILRKIAAALDVSIHEIMGDGSDIDTNYIDSEVGRIMKTRKFNRDTALSYAIDKLVNKPSNIEKKMDLHEENNNLYRAFQDLIENEAIQKEYDYNANDLPCSAIGDLHGFIHDMFKVKLGEIKYNLEKGNFMSDEEMLAQFFINPDTEESGPNDKNK